LIYLVSNVSAVGISPVKRIYDYKPGLEDTLEFQAISNSGVPGYVDITLEGDLAKYGEVINDSAFLQNGERHKFLVHFKLPDSGLEDLVGKQTLWIRVEERPPDSASTTIAVTTAVRGVIVVNFPYPGKYLDISSFNIENVKEGENTAVKFGVVSRGSETTIFTTSLSLYDPTGQTIYEKNFDAKILEADQEYSGNALLDTKLFKPGAYSAKLFLKYEDEEKTAETTFLVGEKNISIDAFLPQILSYGKINEVTISAKSLWNDAFSKVFAVIEIANKSATTPTKGLQPFGSTNLVQFIDTSELDEGLYDADVTVYFDDNVKKKTFSVNISDLTVVEEENGFSISMTTILVTVIVLLVVAIIVIFLYEYLKKKK